MVNYTDSLFPIKGLRSLRDKLLERIILITLRFMKATELLQDLNHHQNIPKAAFYVIEVLYNWVIANHLNYLQNLHFCFSFEWKRVNHFCHNIISYLICVLSTFFSHFVADKFRVTSHNLLQKISKRFWLGSVIIIINLYGANNSICYGNWSELHNVWILLADLNENHNL